jgi:hypothetical protein
LIGNHQQFAAGAPKRLKKRLGLSRATSNALGIKQLAPLTQARPPELCALPRHPGQRPFQPGQLVCLGREGRVTAEIGPLAQQLWLTAGEGNRHQLIATLALHHPEPTLAAGIDQAASEQPPTWFRGGG